MDVSVNTLWVVFFGEKNNLVLSRGKGDNRPHYLITIANQGFPIALSILLIFCIDRFMQEIVTAQKEGYRQVLENTKEIHNTITTLNQQNREYCSLRFTEVQKELSGMKVELRKIE